MRCAREGCGRDLEGDEPVLEADGLAGRFCYACAAELLRQVVAEKRPRGRAPHLSDEDVQRIANAEPISPMFRDRMTVIRLEDRGGRVLWHVSS
jgi:hypothetical protein